MDYNTRRIMPYLRWKQKRGMTLTPHERILLLPRGTDKIIVRFGGIDRAVCKRIWDKLDNAARGRWLDTIRAEVAAA